MDFTNKPQKNFHKGSRSKKINNNTGKAFCESRESSLEVFNYQQIMCMAVQKYVL